MAAPTSSCRSGTASRESRRPQSLTIPSWARPWAPGTTSATRQVSSPISLCGVRDRARRTAISGSSWTPAARPTPTSMRTPSRSASRPRTTATPTISHGRGRSWRACGGCTPSSGRCTRPSRGGAVPARGEAAWDITRCGERHQPGPRSRESCWHWTPWSPPPTACSPCARSGSAQPCSTSGESRVRSPQPTTTYRNGPGGSCSTTAWRCWPVVSISGSPSPAGSARAISVGIVHATVTGALVRIATRRTGRAGARYGTPMKSPPASSPATAPTSTPSPSPVGCGWGSESWPSTRTCSACGWAMAVSATASSPPGSTPMTSWPAMPSSSPASSSGRGTNWAHGSHDTVIARSPYGRWGSSGSCANLACSATSMLPRTTWSRLPTSGWRYSRA
jgi:hypothetical protein